jgi:PAS domain S-box-containing protein
LRGFELTVASTGAGMNRFYGLLLSYSLAVYAVLFCLVGALGYANYRIVSESILGPSAQGWMVDKAGRQRMLAERTAKEFALLHGAILESERERLRAAVLGTLDALLAGHDDVSRHRHTSRFESPAHLMADRQFETVAPLLEGYRRLRADLADAGAPPPASAERLGAVLERTAAYVAAMDEVVAALVDETGELVLRTRRLIVYVGAPTLLALLVGTLVFFWPLVRRLRRSHGELERAHERLQREARARLRLALAVEQTAEGILVCDLQGRIEYVNPALTRMTGYGPQELLGQNPRLLKSGRTDPARHESLWKTVSSGRPWTGRVIDRGKSGTLIEVDLSVTPIQANERITGYLGVMRDVTKETQLESQLRRSQKLEAIGALASGIAHDFNNILTPIMGFTELSLRRLPADADARSALDNVLKAAGRAQDLVRQILTFSRRGEEAAGPVRLDLLLIEVAQLLGSTLPRNVALDSRVSRGLPPVKGNAAQLHTVLMNLCVNAIQAMPDGGKLFVALDAVAPEEAHLPAALPPGGRVVRLTVRDTGAGMDAATQQRIFDPFFTTKPVGQGTGLGLSTAYGIVSQHGGSIAVRSEPGAGAEFQVDLPAPPAQPQAAGPAAALEPRPVQGRILLADDEPAIRALAQEALVAAGHQVVTVSSAEEALQRLRDPGEPFDLLITDLSMPGMSGRELLAAVRRERPGLPTILVSGHLALREEADTGAVPPGTRVLAKPFAIGDLDRTVWEALSAGSGGRGAKAP